MSKTDNPYVPIGEPIPIKEIGVPYGLGEKRIEPGYVLHDGTVVLECERDVYGNYRGGAGMDGMYLNTGKLYAPVFDASGNLQSFCLLRDKPQNYLQAAEMSVEGNYNQIDGIINNEPPKKDTEPTVKPSIHEQLLQATEQEDTNKRYHDKQRGYEPER